MLVLADSTLAVRGLDSLAAGLDGLEVETVVVANGTSVEARQALEERQDIVLVRSRCNLGFGGGNNLAARVSRGRYLLLLNDDSRVEPDFISRLVATMETDSSIGAVGGRILSEDGSLQEAGSVLWSDGWAAHVGLGLPPGDKAFSYVRDVDYTSANGLLVRRTAWDAVGGLDEHYFPAYYEDVDFCMALRRSGLRVVYEPRARLHHLESQSTSDRYRQFLLIRNRDRFVSKWKSELVHFGQRTGDRDDAAIALALHRSRGGQPHLLVAATADADGSEGLWDTVEALASAGWNLTVAVPDPALAAGSASVVGDPGRADRLVDLGVDVQARTVVDILSAADFDFEVLVIGSTTPWSEGPIVRPDGSEIPVVRAAATSDTGHIRRTAERVIEAARRRPEPPPPGGRTMGRYPSGMTEGMPVQGGTPPDEGPSASTPSAGSGHPTSVSGEQTERELRAALWDLEVKDRYIEDLEGKLDDLEARLDEVTTHLQSKTAYIESLPSVRLKVWAKGLRTPSKP